MCMIKQILSAMCYLVVVGSNNGLSSVKLPSQCPRQGLLIVHWNPTNNLENSNLILENVYENGIIMTMRYNLRWHLLINDVMFVTKSLLETWYHEFFDLWWEIYWVPDNIFR